MKKLLSMLTAVLLLMSVTGALADSVRFIENSSTFNIEMELPEGATVSANTSVGEMSIVTVTSEGLADVRITVAGSDIYDLESLADLSDEDVALLAETAGMQYENPDIVIDTTPSGNKYIHICSNAESDIDAIFTLYDGYFIEMTQWHDDYAALTEQDYDFMLQLLHNLTFIPVEK